MNKFQELQHRRSAAGKAEIDKRNNDIKVMRTGILEFFYMEFKENDNNQDKYIEYMHELMSALKDGQLTDMNGNIIIGDNGQPIPRWKPNDVQHAILSGFMSDLGMDMTEVQSLSNRREQRTAKRQNWSGTNADKSAFDGNHESKPYARFANEQAIDEAEQKRIRRAKAEAEGRLYIA